MTLSPRLRSLLARICLIGGVAIVVALMGKSAPHDHTIVVALGSRNVSRIEGVITRDGESEPAVGFSQDFPGASPRTLRHTFSAPNGTYIVVITLRHRPDSAETRAGDGALPPRERRDERDGDEAPIPSETIFERRVSLGDGEVTVSPD